ncbi:MAG: hypothetical protein AUH34_00060 [Gemmatimonadetes bacterium 13_1_40CM_70_12]|nr:MAG: hypothetical protein AUH34_00060 [Gemmatimonadetes bacterium 13_1_40CM_70_12]
MASSGSWSALLARLALRATVNPRLFLPLPPREYTRWRMLTAYGDEHAVPPVEDVINFARWRRETMHV